MNKIKQALLAGTVAGGLFASAPATAGETCDIINGGGAAQANGVNSLACGSGANAGNANEATVVGISSTATANNATAIGFFSVADQGGATAVGSSADALAAGAIAVGQDSSAGGAASIAIGHPMAPCPTDLTFGASPCQPTNIALPESALASSLEFLIDGLLDWFVGQA